MRVFIFFCVFVLFVQNGFAQSTNLLIKEIKIKKKAIDAFTKTADFQSIRFQDESGQETVLVIYMNNQLPVKLSVTNSVSSGKDQKTFYFDEIGCFYVEAFQTTFQRTPRWEEAKSQELGEIERNVSVEKIEKNYFYFKEGKLIEWSSDPSISKTPDSFIKMEAQLIEEAEDLQTRLK